jgi:hypothetical protein
MFFDEDTSGGIPLAERPAGRLLLVAIKAAIAAGGNPSIIVTKVDRLGRDTVDVSQTVNLLESLGARIVFLAVHSTFWHIILHQPQTGVPALALMPFGNSNWSTINGKTQPR